MVTKKKFGIMGGDFRQIYLAKKFYNDGNKVFLFGFDKLKNFNKAIPCENITEIIEASDYIILPLPPTRDGIHLNAPFSKKNITIDDNILNSLNQKIVFGNLSKFTNNTNISQSYNYSKNEEFQIMNAVPTAEGAIKTALSITHRTLFKSNCLIAGFGRIGKILANRLEKFNPNITITARNGADLVWADAIGYNSIQLNEISGSMADYDFIFNTIPKVIFDEALLSKCHKNALIIDLASPPGGIDKAAAEKLKINCRHELAIPGKMFPESAADIIYYSIEKIIKEKFL